MFLLPSSPFFSFTGVAETCRVSKVHQLHCIPFHPSCESLSGSLDSVEPLVAMHLPLGEFLKSGVFLELRNFETSKT